MIDGTRYSLLILFIIPIRGLRLIVYDVFDDTPKNMLRQWDGVYGIEFTT